MKQASLEIHVNTKVKDFLYRVVKAIATHFGIPQFELAKRKQVDTAEVNS